MPVLSKDEKRHAWEVVINSAFAKRYPFHRLPCLGFLINRLMSPLPNLLTSPLPIRVKRWLHSLIYEQVRQSNFVTLKMVANLMENIKRAEGLALNFASPPMNRLHYKEFGHYVNIDKNFLKNMRELMKFHNSPFFDQIDIDRMKPYYTPAFFEFVQEVIEPKKKESNPNLEKLYFYPLKRQHYVFSCDLSPGLLHPQLHIPFPSPELLHPQLQLSVPHPSRPQKLFHPPRKQPPPQKQIQNKGR